METKVETDEVWEVLISDQTPDGTGLEFSVTRALNISCTFCSSSDLEGPIITAAALMEDGKTYSSCELCLQHYQEILGGLLKIWEAAASPTGCGKNVKLRLGKVENGERVGG